MALDANPYLDVIHRNLPRLLAQFNADTTHPLYGCGDRRYWAWKLIDFPNGTFQGASFGLAKLLANAMLPDDLDEAVLFRRIEGMIEVVPQLADRKGSLSEALPNEGSFCVTGLVLGDCLGALAALDARIEGARRDALVASLSPLADFLMRQDETHGIISNHLASTALAMARWGQMARDPSATQRAGLWIDRIHSHAHKEGWMREYEGADPGYQSWCTSALVQIGTEFPDFEVDNLLQRSFSFLESFAMPDGRFANGCGARMTRFFMPGGAEGYSSRSPAAARLANFARQHASRNSFVCLDSIDEPNLAPFFNDMVNAAVNARELGDTRLPVPTTRSYPAAGLYTHAGTAGQLLINSNRGGWMARSRAGKSGPDAPEPAARSSDGTVLRPVRGKIVEHSESEITLQADLEPVERMLPSPSKFVVLRVLALTVFRSARLGNWIKQILARILLSESGKSTSRVERKIDLERGNVTDRIIQGDAELINSPKGFSPMHMASQGYWQVSDDSAPES